VRTINKERYILNTSTIITFAKDEDGSDVVQRLLDDAKANKCFIYISFASFMEIYYVYLQEQGEVEADRWISVIENFPVKRVESSEQLGKIAGKLKANYKISFADAWIAAVAKFKNGILVHKDPEFEQLEGEIRALKLPYKKSA
jgi:predicted nucleic acid-binding protein